MTTYRDRLRARILDVLAQPDPLRADDLVNAGVPRRFAASVARDGRRATTATERHAVANEWSTAIAEDQSISTQDLVNRL